MAETLIEELKRDIEEYEQFHQMAKRPRVQEALWKEIEKLKRDLHKKQMAASSSSNSAAVEHKPQVYQESITNYAWDQSDKFMKLYLTMDKLNSLTEDDIEKEFGPKSVTVRVRFPEKVSTLHISRLCEPIVPGECYCKKKSDYILVMLKKSEAGKTWPWVTEREKKAKEKDKPKFDENDDPSAGITKMLQNMYEDGDDEMKRTISKAFYESQMKQARGDNSMDGL